MYLMINRKLLSQKNKIESNQIKDYQALKSVENKDILKSVKGQAATLRNIRAVSFVRPILCFTEADLMLNVNPISGVHITNLDGLLYLLRLLNCDV